MPNTQAKTQKNEQLILDTLRNLNLVAEIFIRFSTVTIAIWLIIFINLHETKGCFTNENALRLEKKWIIWLVIC